jgi:hypothetical protein
MEHITISEFATRAAITVPYVCSKFWDNSSFLDYMSREGWSEIQLIGHDDQYQRSEVEILDFLQTWLFFGLLRESCGLKGSEGYFLHRESDGRYVLHTKALRTIWREEKRRWAGEPKETYHQWQLYLMRCLNTAHSVLARLTMEKMPYLSSPVIFSIATLCGFVKLTILGDETRPLCNNLPSGLFKVLENKMFESGWCPTNIRRFSTELDAASLFLVASQPPPDPEKRHPNCDNQECKAYQVDENSYAREHGPACDRKNCCDLKLDPIRLHAILSSGSIIFTKYSETSAGEPELEAIKAVPEGNYVAISHVWSDGFGNPKENALFSCQARRFAQYGRDVRPSSDGTTIPFWLDTLSCPVVPEEATDLAISMMRETYADADAVLVLNNHLLYRKKPELGLEVLAMILATSWTRRLWTLQEGVLAKRLVFQFLDEAIDMDTAIGLAQLEMKQFLEPESMEYASLINAAITLHDLWQNGENELTDTRLHLLHSQLKWRSTSVPTDEPLCIGALLGISLEEIVKAAIPDRKTQLWESIKTPPRVILFWTGDRLKDAGFRWAPASLLGDSLSYFSEVGLVTTRQPKPGDLARTKVSKKGLVTGADALSLGNWTSSIPSGFFVAAEGVDKLFWVTRFRKSDDSRPLRLLEATNNDEAPAKVDRILSIILRDAAENIFFSDRQEGGHSGLLVSHVEDKGEIIETTVEDMCTIFPMYFLTADQREYVSKTVQECLESLGTAGSNAEVEIDGPNHSRLPTAQFNPDGVTEREKEFLHVSRDGGGARRIVYNDRFWWMECVSIIRNQVWCLD